MEYDDLIRKVVEGGRTVEFYGPQSRNDVRRLEETLGVVFPISFVRFLEHYGGGGVVGEWISGIYDHDPLLMNAGSVYGDTMRCRQTFDLPPSLVVIYTQDDEIVWCLDTSVETVKGENPVVSFDVFTQEISNRIAESFADYLREYLEIRCRD